MKTRLFSSVTSGPLSVKTSSSGGISESVTHLELKSPTNKISTLLPPVRIHLIVLALFHHKQ